MDSRVIKIGLFNGIKKGKQSENDLFKKFFELVYFNRPEVR